MAEAAQPGRRGAHQGAAEAALLGTGEQVDGVNLAGECQAGVTLRAEGHEADDLLRVMCHEDPQAGGDVVAPFGGGGIERIEVAVGHDAAIGLAPGLHLHGADRRCVGFSGAPDHWVRHGRQR